MGCGSSTEHSEQMNTKQQEMDSAVADLNNAMETMKNAHASQVETITNEAAEQMHAKQQEMDSAVADLNNTMETMKNAHASQVEAMTNEAADAKAKLTKQHEQAIADLLSEKATELENAHSEHSEQLNKKKKEEEEEARKKKEEEEEQQQPKIDKRNYGVSAKQLRHIRSQLASNKGLKTFQLFETYVKGLTEDRKCSLAESLEDPSDAAPATVFVSHSYGAPFADSLEVMLRYEQSHPGTYYWYDPFSLNQYASADAVLDTATLEETFRSQIQTIGATLIVATPWKDPLFLKRAWCLFELYITHSVGAHLTIDLPTSEETDFLESVLKIGGSANTILDALGRIDSKNAQAREEKDRKSIIETVQRTVGCNGLNKLALERMTKWWFKVAHDHITKLEKQDNRRKLGQHINATGMLVLQLGFLEESLDLFQRAITTFTEADGPDSKDVVACRSNLAVVYEDLGKIDEAVKMMKSIVGSNPDMKDFGTLSTVNNLALILMDTDPAQAEHYFRQVLEARQELQGAKHVDTICVRLNLARSIQVSGKLEEAETAVRQVIEDSTAVSGEMHPSTLNAQKLLGNILVELWKNDDARELYDACLEPCKTRFGEDSTDYLSLINDIGMLDISENKYKQAEERFLYLIEMYEKKFSDDHPNLLSAIGNLATVYNHLNRYDEAIKLSIRDLKATEAALGPSSDVTRLCMSNHAVYLEKAEKWEEASGYFERCMNLSDKYRGPGHVSTLKARARLALFRSRWLKVEGPASGAGCTIEDLKQEIIEVGNKFLSTGYPRESFDIYMDVFGPAVQVDDIFPK